MEKLLEDDTKDVEIPFDEILNQIGQFGRYQKVLYAFICFPLIASAFPTMSMVFTLGSHLHRYKILLLWLRVKSVR